MKSRWSIKADAPYDEFIGLHVDDEYVDESNYTVKSGSTILTLKKAYLETLFVGKHEVTMGWNGGSAKTTLTIAAAIVVIIAVRRTFLHLALQTGISGYNLVDSAFGLLLQTKTMTMYC